MLHQIGVGALGPVFRTYEPSRDRLVAVKVFRLDITPEQAQTLADELTRAAEAGLFHPSIVEPVAAGVQGTVAYRAEEYVPAESLDVAMGHYAPAAPDKILPFITQLAGAIDFARAAGIGHGALHPRDIFVTPDEARATGFGVVDALERVGLRAPVRRPYSPPERIAGEPWGTPADVFSLAAIAFELLTGRRPSGTGDRIGAIGGAARTHAVLARAMHEDPSKRYSTALEFAEALEHAARYETAQTEAVAPPEAVTATPPVAAVATSVREMGVAGDAAAAPQPGGEDDITSEREEDEAHWELALKEQESPGIEADQPAELFADEQVEAAADRLALEAADLALDETPADEPFLNEIESEEGKASRSAPLSLDLGPSEEEAASKDAPTAPPRSFIPVAVPPARPDRPSWTGPEPRALSDSYDRPLAEEESRESRIVVERTRTAMLPIAVSLMVGLPLAFAAGYIVRGREVVTVPVATTTGTQGSAATPAASAPPGESTPAGKEWSEQAVAQPSTRPAAPTSTPKGPTEAPAAAAERTDTAPAPAAPRTGRIVVRSTPSRAGVTVNGIWRGRTPLTLDDLSFGRYVVRVVAEGYQIAREEFSLSASNASRTVSMQLERQRPPAVRGRPNPPAPRPAAPAEGRPGAYFGVVFVDSRPQGAKVFIAGREYGKTPLRIPEVPIGSHVVRLELPDHSSWTKPIRVAAGQEVRVTGSLEPIR